MLAAAWSADGSLLAAAAGDTATLWEPTSNALLATLPTPLPAVGTPLRHLAFVAGTPFLVCLGADTAGIACAELPGSTAAFRLDCYRCKPVWPPCIMVLWAMSTSQTQLGSHSNLGLIAFLCCRLTGRRMCRRRVAAGGLEHPHSRHVVDAAARGLLPRC